LWENFPQEVIDGKSCHKINNSATFTRKIKNKIKYTDGIYHQDLVGQNFLPHLLMESSLFGGNKHFVRESYCI
jgi:hypothetical protein